LQEHFETVMGRAGVGNDSHVVLYASTAGQRIYNNTMWCTRAWWILHHFGVRAAVLNGSLEKWVAEGRPVSTSPGTYPATTFTASPQWRRGLASKEDVLAALRDPRSACVVDALSKASFAGTEPLPDGRKKGHITGAVNVPMHVLVDRETGVFASADDIRAHFERAGALPARKVITYCGGAIAATVDAFALALLGYPDIAVYDGSLNEWGLDTARKQAEAGGSGSGSGGRSCRVVLLLECRSAPRRNQVPNQFPGEVWLNERGCLWVSLALVGGNFLGNAWVKPGTQHAD